MLSFMVTSVPLFKEATCEVTEAIVERLRSESYARDSTIIKEGRRGRALFILRSGECEAVVNSNVVATMRVGDQFGELSLLFPDRPTGARVRARTAVEVTSCAHS